MNFLEKYFHIFAVRFWKACTATLTILDLSAGGLFGLFNEAAF